MGAEVVLGEGYGEGGVGGEVEGGVALAPVSLDCQWGAAKWHGFGMRHYLMTAMFTGA